MAQETEQPLGAGKRGLVISPIGDEFAPFGTDAHNLWANNIQLWEKVFRPVCEHLGLEIIRSDKITESGDIPEQIFTLLRDADVVIADVSGGNANVMYELGLRHTKNLLTIPVGEHSRLPFDINTIRTIQFQRTEAGFIDLRSRLLQTLEVGLKGTFSPVRATQVWAADTPLDQSLVQDAIAKSQVEDDDTEIDEPGFLDILAEAEASVQDVTGVMEAIGDELTLVGALMADAKAALEASDKAKKGFAGRVRVSRQLAKDLAEPVANLERLGEQFETHMRSATRMVDYAVDRLDEDPSNYEDLRGFAEHVVPASQVAAEFAETVAQIVKGARDVQRVSRDLKEPGKQLERAMGRVMNGVQKVAAWGPALEGALHRAQEAQ